MTMPTNSHSATVSKKALWAGWILSALPVLMLLLSAVMKLAKPPPVVQGFGQLGIDLTRASALGILELLCLAVYLIPSTAVLGAILLTGYFGGATAITWRVGQSVFGPILMGVLLWGGLYLRDPRLRALIPLRR